MKKQFSLAVKIGVIVLALIGALLVGTVVTLIAVDWYRISSRSAPESIQRLHDLYGGTVVREGVVLRQVSKSAQGVTASYTLVQALFDQTMDASNRVLIVGWRPVKSDLVEKLERGDLDLAKFGASASLKDWTDAEGYIGTSGGLVKLNGKEWETAQWAVDFVNVPAADAERPHFEMVRLNDSAPVLAVVGPNETQYFTGFGKDFIQILSVTTAYDDLDACLNDEAEVQARAAMRQQQAASAAEAAASAALSAASSATKRSVEEDEEEEEIPDHPADYVCVQFKAEVSIQDAMDHGFRQLKVSVQGKNRDRKDYRRELTLRYDAREREYQFKGDDGAWQSSKQMFDAQLDSGTTP